MNRETVIVPDKKDRISKIREKYHNPSMSEEAAKKIGSLQTTNTILKAATAVAGIATTIDLFAPDAIPVLDAKALTSITSLLATTTTIVDNKIDLIAKNGNDTMKLNEISKLGEQLKNVVAAVGKNQAVQSR